VLPNTGGPRWWVLPVGIGLLLAGAGLMLGEEAGRRRRA
jgi:LPXTG-motif cell wall-anchored protein